MTDRPFTWHYLEGFLEHPDDHPFLKEANARRRLYENAPVFLPDTGVVCGNLDMALYNEVVTNRISRHFLNNDAYKGVLASENYSPGEKAELQRRMELFKPEILSNRADAAYSEDELLAWESVLATSNHYNGHQVLDYGLLLAEGIPGVIRRARSGLKRIEQQPDIQAQDAVTSAAMYRSIVTSFEAAGTFIRRHADLARQKLADDGLPSEEVERLGRIASICENISGKAPADFAEGVCLLWFFIGFADYDSSGRLDQYLFPLFSKSRSSGMSADEAKRLLADFWLMLDRNGAILNMTIGGCRADGSSDINELTWLVLELTRELRLKGPNLCLRLPITDTEESARLWETVHLNLSAGQALPALYNDAVILPMLIREGIPAEDAHGYCLAGCSQIVIPGKSSFACDIGTYNPLKCLELALHDGFDRRIGKQVGPHTGTPESMTGYDAVWGAWLGQVEHAIKVGVSVNNKDHGLRLDMASCIRTALTSDCLDRGKTLFLGGARYYAVQNEVVGLTNTANALLAIKRVVFEECRLNLAKLVEVLDGNFQEDETLRQYLINKVPKFGNGDPEVDGLRNTVTREFFTRLAANPAPLGGRHWPGEVIFHYNVQLGRATLASADGRRNGEPFADSAGPSQGTDQEGVMGILESMGRIEPCTADFPNTCCCLNLKFDLRFWKRAGRQLIDLLRTYMRTGFQVQINVLDAKDLAEALVHPELYRGLVVRVGGYSAYFTSLDPDIQRDIISRTTQASL